MVLGVESLFIRVSKATVSRQDYNFMDIYFQIKKIDQHIYNIENYIKNESILKFWEKLLGQQSQNEILTVEEIISLRSTAEDGYWTQLYIAQ